jgi:hypothetical protein
MRIADCTEIGAHDRTRLPLPDGRIPLAPIQWIASACGPAQLRLASVDILGRVVVSVHAAGQQPDSYAPDPDRTLAMSPPNCRTPGGAVERTILTSA